MLGDGGLVEGQAFSEILENGNTVKIKCTFKKSDDTGEEFAFISFATFDTASKLLSGMYIEVQSAGESDIKGQAQFSSVGTDYTADFKLDFNTDSGSMRCFTKLHNTGGDELMTAELRPDDVHSATHGVYLATRFEMTSSGRSTEDMNMGWADDGGGGVQTYHAETVNSVTSEGMYSEYFVFDGSTSKIIYRENGEKNLNALFEALAMARSGTVLNAYPESVPGAFTTASPDMIELRDTETGYDIYGYIGENDVSGTLIQSVTDSDWTPGGDMQLYWLKVSGTAVQTGDAMYTIAEYLAADAEQGTPTLVRYEKAMEVPAATTRFGKTGFYFMKLYPLKYVTGLQADNTNTLIQSETVGSDLYYYIDIDGDISYDTVSG